MSEKPDYNLIALRRVESTLRRVPGPDVDAALREHYLAYRAQAIEYDLVEAFNAGLQAAHEIVAARMFGSAKDLGSYGELLSISRLLLEYPDEVEPPVLPGDEDD